MSINLQLRSIPFRQKMGRKLTVLRICRFALGVAFSLSGSVILAGCVTQPDILDHQPLSGRDCVLQALQPQFIGGIFCRSGLIATALSSGGDDLKKLKRLDSSGIPNCRPFNLRLKDGSKVGGLFFPYADGTSEPKPLLIASFGFLQDRWGTESAKFYEFYLREPSKRIPAHVLILDHPSAGTFLANNGHLSVGTYDDARMWIAVAAHLRDKMDVAGIHLFGVSMSGQTVVHALIEDVRLGLNLFDSGMAVSIAPDFQEAPGKHLALMETPKGVENPWRPYFNELPQITFVDVIQRAALVMLIENQFLPHYRLLNPLDKTLDIEKKEVPVFLRRAFEERINVLRKIKDDSWNSSFQLENLDAFMASTRIAGVVDRVSTPLVLVSAYDDPAVERSMFQEVVRAVGANPWIAAVETENGGHFGFDVAYGEDYLGRVIAMMMDQQILTTWNDTVHSHFADPVN